MWRHQFKNHLRKQFLWKLKKPRVLLSTTATVQDAPCQCYQGYSWSVRVPMGCPGSQGPALSFSDDTDVGAHLLAVQRLLGCWHPILIAFYWTRCPSVASTRSQRFPVHCCCILRQGLQLPSAKQQLGRPSATCGCPSHRSNSNSIIFKGSNPPAFLDTSRILHHGSFQSIRP